MLTQAPPSFVTAYHFESLTCCMTTVKEGRPLDKAQKRGDNTLLTHGTTHMRSGTKRCNAAHLFSASANAEGYTCGQSLPALRFKRMPLISSPCLLASLRHCARALERRQSPTLQPSAFELCSDNSDPVRTLLSCADYKPQTSHGRNLPG